MAGVPVRLLSEEHEGGEQDIRDAEPIAAAEYVLGDGQRLESWRKVLGRVQ